MGHSWDFAVCWRVARRLRKRWKWPARATRPMWTSWLKISTEATTNASAFRAPPWRPGKCDAKFNYHCMYPPIITHSRPTHHQVQHTDKIKRVCFHSFWACAITRQIQSVIYQPLSNLWSPCNHTSQSMKLSDICIFFFHVTCLKQTDCSFQFWSHDEQREARQHQ